jgi:hypothetical protein
MPLTLARLIGSAKPWNFFWVTALERECISVTERGYTDETAQGGFSCPRRTL